MDDAVDMAKKKPASQQRAAFASRLKVRRQEKFDSAAALAEKLGMNEHTYRRWERGETEPGIADLAKLHRTLEVSLDFLIAGTTPAQALSHGFRDADDTHNGRFAG